MELKAMQQMIHNFTTEKGINTEVSVRMLDLVSEVGELSKEILIGANYGTRKLDISEGFKSEVGDILFSLICLANEAEVDLEESLIIVLEKYKKRFINKGHIGSEK